MTRLWPFLTPPSDHDRADLRAVSARGTRVRFADGRKLLCATSGLWNVNLGYGNPRIADAIHETLRTASYLTLFRYTSKHAARAAEKLINVGGSDRFAKVLFATSGGAANDMVMKLARHYQALRGHTGRVLVVSLRGSYHGMTFGGFSLTGEELGQALYGVDKRLNRHVAANDIGELDMLLAREGHRVAAVIVEPVLGSGAVALSEEYTSRLLKARAEHGFLLVADEVATGFGRTGEFFAFQRWTGAPDVVIVSKGLTNGTCAASAVLVSGEVAAAFAGGDTVFVHAETQAGTPPSCAAIIATIEEMDRVDAVARAQALSRWLDGELRRLVAEHPTVTSASGVGCFRAVTLATSPEQTAAVVAKIRRAGAIVHPGPRGFQLVPSLTYSHDDLELLFRAVREGLR